MASNIQYIQNNVSLSPTRLWILSIDHERDSTGTKLYRNFKWNSCIRPMNKDARTKKACSLQKGFDSSRHALCLWESDQMKNLVILPYLGSNFTIFTFQTYTAGGAISYFPRWNYFLTEKTLHVYSYYIVFSFITNAQVINIH